MRYCSCLTLLFLLLATPSARFSWSANVVSIADGDAITVLRNNQQNKSDCTRLNARESAEP
jgi:hypothetical protein